MKEEEKSKSEVAKREEEVLKFWQENQIFEKSLEKDAPNGNFVFYDGPPFATGQPHYGHILAGTIKDAIPRYQTMKGKKVLRRWGWDCHGLPVENLIEKELKLESKKDILDYGIDKFNQKAKESVMQYTDVWKNVIPRMGRWVDMENDYRTMDKTYTESVWWSFKTLYDKGLIYKSFKSMHLCPRCETTLSNFEVNLGYKDITDISVFVEFELIDEPNTFLLVWTTTPWTLPGNVALAINKDIEYVEVSGEVEGNKYILAKSRAESVFKGKFKILRTVTVSDLVGKKYKPLFDYYFKDEKLENRENGWKIYADDFVTSEDGTGIVHIAPAFGEDDFNLLKANDLPFVQHIANDGTFKKEVTDFSGLSVKPKSDEKDGHQKTDIEIIKYLAHKNLLFAKEKIVHSYPHCWRCDTPLLNFATSSWFVKVSEFKDKMVEMNKGIKWLPKEIGENRFGDWLQNARDWAISRARFWGAPLPVWTDSKGKIYVIGSVDDLKARIKKRNNYFLVRHGEADNNVMGDMIMTKVDDKCHLTPNGKDEAKSAGALLKDKKIDLIISSPFLRTKETAEIIAKEVGFKDKIIFDDRIIEIQAGQFDGMTWPQYLKEQYPTPKDRFEKKIEGTENWNDVRKRMMGFMYDIDSKYEGKNILVVSHGAPLHLTALSIKGFSVREMETANYYEDSFYNAEVREIDFRKLPKNENFEIDLHKPFIDNIELFGDDGEKLERIPDVFDCWYESGSMFFAQNHYPFKNKEEFEKNGSSLFPADFIAEGLDQTRGWFYTLLVLGTGLFGKSPYENVVVNGLVLAEDGRKMSKKLKNYPDPMDIVNKFGADALRYFMLSSPLVKAEDFNFSEKGVDEVYKKIILKMENVLSFYEMYKAVDEPIQKPKLTELDRWIMARLSLLEKTISESMDKYELDRATRPIMEFVDDLSTWYIRLSRERFKSEDELIKNTSLAWTRYTLEGFSMLTAPFMPFLAENIFRRVSSLIEEPLSVHLQSWPDNLSEHTDDQLLGSMSKARELVSKVLEVRSTTGIKVKQPLANLTIKENFSDEIKDLILKEVNVKEIKTDSSLNKDFVLDTNITEELREEGIARELVRSIQEQRKNKNFSAKDKIDISFSLSNQEFIEKYLEKITKGAGLKTINFKENDFDLQIQIDSHLFKFTFN
jgi:isoleucyl-tRNA synthetase